jgi:hypothetical protein
MFASAWRNWPAKLVSLPLALAGVAHLPRDVDGSAAFHRDAAGEALRFRPTGRLQDLHQKRCSLPVSVRGSASTNSIARGYLYGAIALFTCSCSALTISGSARLTGLQHDVGLDDLPRSGIRRAHHAALGHRRVREQRVLDLGPAML